mmetsp:Transcript_1419/g.2519  ORF Transcript_1419/g.2519 Transcript_1419/m.2519 type:complete len:150 (+) Transcript_1419:29-478(+)
MKHFYSTVEKNHNDKRIMSSILNQLSTSDIECEHIDLRSDDSWANSGGEISERLRMKIFGTSSEEMKNWSALQRLGITYAEFERGNAIVASTPPCFSRGEKTERLTGYSMTQIKRAKALSVLGTTEDEIYDLRAKKLGKIGRFFGSRQE